MRRENKYILNGALITGGIVLTADILMQWLAKKESGEKLTWENFDGERALKRTLWGLGLGGIGGYLYYKYKISEEEKLPFSSDEHLKKVLSEEHLKSNPQFFNAVLSRRKKIKQWLGESFGNKLAAFPQDSGSFAKRTAIASNYDLDIILIFKKSSYATLEEMYYDVYNVVRIAFGTKATITKQTKAIGVTFEYGGEEIHFDIVPGRETDNYQKEKNINLYVRPDWVWQRGRSFKTNFDLQRNITVNKPEARKVIKLLKVYRDTNNLKLRTIIIEQSVTQAMSENNFGIHASDTENLLNSMDYLAKKMEQKSLIDIANSNNNLHDRVSGTDRYKIANQLFDDVKKIEDNPRYIKEIFDA